MKRFFTFQEIEARYFKSLMRKAAGNIFEAVRISGLGRSTIYRKLLKYDIDRFWFLDEDGRKNRNPWNFKNQNL